MAAENISDIISKEAIQQLLDLGKQLEITEENMYSLIEAVVKLNNELKNANGYKDTLFAINNLNKATQELHQENLSRLEIERKIKKSGDEMVKTIRDEKESLELLNKVLEENTVDNNRLVSTIDSLKKEFKLI